jgi:predicted  nucleic acid-binding Zn-ribbon protein
LESKLRNLYTLQLIDNTLDELNELKGDLPAQVAQLNGTLEDLNRRIAELDQTMKSAFSMRENADNEILSLKEKLERYKAQQLEVRTNREYDALTREMEHAELAVARLEQEMEALENKATLARNDIEVLRKEADEIIKQLDEKQKQLLEVSKANEDEELKYTHEREKIVARIAKSDLIVYERIRGAKKGKAVVKVIKGSCGGCFNVVPPQKLLELRQNTRLFTCERCGRILVSDEIAQTVTVAV